jgi:hypothetical protein
MIYSQDAIEACVKLTDHICQNAYRQGYRPRRSERVHIIISSVL